MDKEGENEMNGGFEHWVKENEDTKNWGMIYQSPNVHKPIITSGQRIETPFAMR